MRTGAYKICQGCLGAIFRNGILVRKRIGKGYEKEGKFYHQGCFNKFYKKWRKKNFK